jgi:hypothetical protein
MPFNATNTTTTWCPDSVLNFSWVLNATMVPGLEDWPTSSGGTRRRQHPHLQMSWWQQLGWSAVFAIMLVVAIGGNTIVMWIVLGELSFFLLSTLHSVFLVLFNFFKDLLASFLISFLITQELIFTA